MIKCESCGEISKDPTTERCPHCDAAAATLVDMKVDHPDEEPNTEVAVPALDVLPDGLRFCLTLTHGETSKAQARLFDFREEEQIIGRLESVDVYIALPSLSRQHASFWLKEGTPHIRDLGSLTGTLVNNVRITEPTAISEGDRISLGDSVHLMTTIEEGAVPRRGDLTVEKSLSSVMRIVAEDERHEGVPRPHLELIADLCTRTAFIADEAALLSTTLEILSDAIPATRFLALMGASVDELTVVAERRKDGASEPLSPPSRGILRRVMYSLSGSPFVTCDAQGEEHLKQRRSIMVSNIRSVICASLTDGSSCIGMLYADGQVVDTEISVDDESFLFIVARLTHDRIMARRNAASLAQLQPRPEQ